MSRSLLLPYVHRIYISIEHSVLQLQTAHLPLQGMLSSTVYSAPHPSGSQQTYPTQALYCRAGKDSVPAPQDVGRSATSASNHSQQQPSVPIEHVPFLSLIHD